MSEEECTQEEEGESNLRVSRSALKLWKTRTCEGDRQTNTTLCARGNSRISRPSGIFDPIEIIERIMQ